MAQSVPTSNQVTQAWISQYLSDTCTSIPGYVHEYDKATNTCSVQPSVKMTLPNGSNINYPILGNASVIFPSTPRSAISFPIKKGDPVLIIFSQRSLDSWQVSDGDQIVNPQDARVHNLSDAIVIPGLFPNAKSPVSTLTGQEEDLILAHNIGTAEESLTVMKADGNIEFSPVTLVTINGNLIVTEDITAVNITASAAVNAATVTATGIITGGSITTSGAITGGTVTAGSVGLATHTHPFTYSAGPTAGVESVTDEGEG